MFVSAAVAVPFVEDLFDGTTGAIEKKVFNSFGAWNVFYQFRW